MQKTIFIFKCNLNLIKVNVISVMEMGLSWKIRLCIPTTTPYMMAKEKLEYDAFMTVKCVNIKA